VRIALKIDVCTLHGTREGVPRLAAALERRGVRASFFFSLGPDHGGRALRRIAGRAWYGFPGPLYGILLPGPDIGRRCTRGMRAVRDAGHEVGIHAWDAAGWLNRAAGADAEWTLQAMERACVRFADVFGEPPRAHAAPGWQMNAHAWRLTQRLGFDYGSDTRGTEPFMPIRQAELVDCPQVPTTLPTLDELIGRDGVKPDNVADRLLEHSTHAPATGHVFSLRAEVEGGRLLPAFERLLDGWTSSGVELVPTRTVFESVDRAVLPRCTVAVGTIAGRSGTLALQSHPFLA
jgi:peptidoglycan/xylan/chitin deacetylase (PgdA/CDA1 family)